MGCRAKAFAHSHHARRIERGDRRRPGLGPRLAADRRAPSRRFGRKRKMARIGILAFGSLIGNPGDEIAALEVAAERRRGVLTPFQVEFARSSTKRGGAPTLVPYLHGDPVNAEILVVEATDQLARDALWRRETDNLDSKRGYREPKNPGTNTLIIKSFENFEGLPLVLAAFFPATIEHPTPTLLAELAIQSAQDCTVQSGRDGISYLIEVKCYGIVTPLSPNYETEILRITGTATLAEARAKLTRR